MKICSICQYCYEGVATSCANDDHGELIESRPGGRQISAKYRLDVWLERGLASETYQATDITAKKSVVLRLIDPNLTGDLMLIRERLNAEVRAAAEINHPNVVKINDYGVLGNNEIFIATETNSGEQTLREYLKDKGSLPEAIAVVIARQAADGLEAAHSAGIIHRNLSPANLLITFNEQEQPFVKLQNFDLGGILQRVVTESSSNAAPFLEAFRYFSPEQCAGQTADARTDIYSLGVVLYEMLSGRLLFDEPTTAAIVEKKNNAQLPPLNHLHFDVKALLTHTLMRSLNKRPDLRPPTAAGFARNLRHLEYITKQFSSFAKKSPVNQPTKKVAPSFEKSPSGVPLMPSVNSSVVERKSQSPQNPIVAEVATKIKSPIVAPSVIEISEPATLVSAPIVDFEPIRVQKKSVASDLLPEPIRVAKKEVSIPVLATGATVSKAQTADVVKPPAQLVANSPLAASNAEESNDSATLNRQSSFDGPLWQEPVKRKSSLIINSSLIVVLLAMTVLGIVVVAAMKSWPPQTEQAALAPTSTGETVNEPAESAVSNPSKGGVSTLDKRNSTVSERSGKNVSRDDAPLTGSVKSKQNPAVPSPVQPTNVEASKNSQPRETATNGNSQAELGASLNKWIEATNSRDVDQQMNYYAPKINSYYLARNASQEKVKAEKKRVFENASIVNIQAGKPEIALSNDGQSARMLFHKKYSIKKGRQDKSGEVIQELQWVKSKNGWKIVSERDVKVINR